MKVAIIGGGAAGLAAVKNCLDENVECEAFEQNETIGGTWNYVEETVDKNGLPFHTSMYHGLVTNLPKELMEFENFHYKDSDHSFVTQPEVLEYIHQYANHYKLLPYIKFYHRVEFVNPQSGEKWTVQVRNLKTNEVITNTFDGVLVCNGHFFSPFYPTIPGMENFEGRNIHSHFYRRPDKYKGRRVLVIGGGLSGVDIARIVSGVADKVFFSFRKEKILGRSAADRSITKPGIERLLEKRVIFTDGTEEEIDEIIYCTGYNNTFPFFSENCQVRVDDNWVQPLYKHLINIEHPSMAIINMVTYACAFPLFGMQIRFYLALLKGDFYVSKENMYEDLRMDRKMRDKEGFPKKYAHFLGSHQMDYCNDLASIAKIRNLPPVIGILFKYLIANNIPRDNYRIVNDDEFKIIPMK